MAQPIAEVDGRQLAKSVTLRVTITHHREMMLRLKLGALIIRFAAFVMGTDIEFKSNRE